MGKKFQGILCKECKERVQKQIYVTGNIHVDDFCNDCLTNLMNVLDIRLGSKQ